MNADDINALFAVTLFAVGFVLICMFRSGWSFRDDDHGL